MSFGNTYPNSLCENCVFVIQFGRIFLVFDASVVSFLAEAHYHDLLKNLVRDPTCIVINKGEKAYLPLFSIDRNSSVVGASLAAGRNPWDGLDNLRGGLSDLSKGGDNLLPPVFDQFLRNFSLLSTSLLSLLFSSLRERNLDLRLIHGERSCLKKNCKHLFRKW